MFGVKLNKYGKFSPIWKLWEAVARHNFKWLYKAEAYLGEAAAYKKSKEVWK